MTADSPHQLDVLVIGAGFAGFTCLHKLRNLGLCCKLFERQPNSGGIWRQNRYPGARVDSDLPIYQFSDRELWQDWTWTERFPAWNELREYFQYVEQKWDLRRDIEYNRNIISMSWDELRHRWTVTCEDGTKVSARWVLAGLGFASKKFVPSMKGLESFKGECHHTSEWPEGGLDVKGKRVAVIGTGASGVQTIQEIAPEVAKLTVYQRTPNLCLPMGQVPVSKELQEEMKKDGTYENAFRRLRDTTAAFTFDFVDTATFDEPPEAREALWEGLYAHGGFHPWLGGYKDMYTSQAANDLVYDFWCKKVHARVHDEKKADILAPRKPPHPFGTKRPCLEQNFYEVFNQDNVDVVDLQASPIEEITETGIRNEDGRVEEFDIIVLATGFDAITGGMTQIELRGTDGMTMEQRWKANVYSHLGMTYHHYPNLFSLYAPLGPTAFSNGPTCVEIQSEWITGVIKYCHEKGLTRFETTRKAEEEWKADTNRIWYGTLFPKAKSWYQGSNIPGKPTEPLNWFGGVGNYRRILEEIAEKNYKGFRLDPPNLAQRLFEATRKM